MQDVVQQLGRQLGRVAGSVQQLERRIGVGRAIGAGAAVGAGRLAHAVAGDVHDRRLVDAQELLEIDEAHVEDGIEAKRLATADLDRGADRQRLALEVQSPGAARRGAEIQDVGRRSHALARMRGFVRWSDTGSQHGRYLRAHEGVKRPFA